VANRHALLIGVPRYDLGELNDPRLADAVRCDIDAMRTALRQSDYKITECGMSDSGRGQASLNHINQAIEEACANVPAGGVLLVYFSGHGIAEAGTDYLVPSDAYLPGGGRSADRPSLRSLVKVIPPDEVLRDCRARLVVFFVDACRNESAIGKWAESRPSVEPGGQLPFLADGGHFVLITGCGAGQVCQYDETGSVFTRALASAIDSGNSARTLAAVVADITKEMARNSRQPQGSAQMPTVRYPEMLALAGQVLICDGDELTDAWRKAVAASSLVSHCGDPDHVYDVVDECARRCRAAMQYLRSRTGLDDPWTDQNYPARVLANAELLLRNAGLLEGLPGSTETARSEDEATCGLRPGEAALVLTAPFLREVVLAVGIRDAAAIEPADLRRTYGPGDRSDLELTHEMYQHLVRRAVGLRRRAEDGPEPRAARASDQLAMWLVHRWLTGRATLWQGDRTTEICKLCVNLVADCRGATDEEVPQLVQAMLLAIGADPVDEQLRDRLSKPYVSDRWRMIAAVLWLAGIMAADPRQLPPVVADLVGTGMELPLTHVQAAAASRASWVQADGGLLDLHLVCDHPALHDAFEDIVRRANRAALTIKAKLDLPPVSGAGLPRGFTPSPPSLRPSTRPDQTPAYQVPLARFQIAEEKVRELLMGRQLYGDPALAIRELYQNALDACRWRATRQEYRRRALNEPAEWTGRIQFTQSTDAEGRPFIECADNGVGMDLGTLEHVFGNAGERFVYRQEFRAEQADWAALDPPLQMVSNSQFGVGVFSYFMLADEITVRTRHHGRFGVPDQDAHEVRIASSGSLFQIQPTQGLPGGGTCVRLYLSGEASEVSVLRTLRDLLWISEYRVEVFEGEDQEIWEPGKLRYPEGTVPPCQCGEDLWWVSAEGGLAADGIGTNEERFGLIVNLREKRRPQFTVDRRSLEGWDRDWVRETIAKALPELMKWPGFTLAWLWEVTESDPAVAQQIYEHAVATGREVRIGTAWGQAASVALGAVGCLPEDRSILDREGVYRGGWIGVWRGGVWRQWAPSHTSTRLGSAAEQVTGFSVPDPIDAALIEKLALDDPDAMVRRDEILAAVAGHDLTVAAMLRRLRRYAISGINLAQSRYVPASEIMAKEDDDADAFRALAAWPLPGDEAARTSAGPLIFSSSRLGLPLGEVVRRAQRFAPADWPALSFDLATLRHHTCTQAEAILLAQSYSTYRPVRWLHEAFSPAHLAGASEQLGRNFGDILAMCDRLAPLGVTVAMRDAYPEDLQPAEFYALSHIEAAGQALSLLQLVLVAARSGMSVGATHAALARLERSGLAIRPELDGDPEFTPGETHLSFIDSQLRRWDRLTGRRRSFLNKPFILVFLQITGTGGWASKMAARELAPFVKSHDLLTLCDLAQIAASLNITLGEAADKLAELYPEVPLPGLADEYRGLTVSDGIHDALLPWIGSADTGWQIGPIDIVTQATWVREPLGDLLSKLDPFRALGAPVPAYDEAIRNVLNQVSLDGYDSAMLAEYDEFGEQRYLDTITALALVRIAGRFGWSLAHAHWRLARLVPVGVKLAYPVDTEIPEEIVYWHDLQALTKYYDGQEPAISGQITWPELEKAAVEIFDCAPGEIPAKAAFLRDRLRVYASLLQLELPEETASA
jgi:hypothetical protein